MNPDLTRELERITLEMLLDRLSPQDREVIVMWCIEGYTLREIATFINGKYAKEGQKSIGSRAIGARIHKIIKKLREYSGESSSEGDLYIASRKVKAG